MAQLNDYCLLCIEGVSNKINDLEQEYLQLRTGKQKVTDPEFGDITSEVAWSISNISLPRWQDTQEFLVQAMCLLLLSAYTEKSLKSLCADLAPSDGVKPKIIRGQSKTLSYIKFLRESCDLKFNEPHKVLEIRESCRLLRNSFAHGDWDDVRTRMAQTNLQGAFLAVTLLLVSIENAYLLK